MTLSIRNPHSPIGNGAASPFRSLRHRNYRLYFIGQLISLTGSWMQMPALMWLAWELTEQSRWPSWIAAAQFVPTFLFGFLGGSLADRWPKRALLFWAQIGLLLVPLVYVQLVLGNVASPWPYLLVAALSGLIGAIDFPTRLSFVMDMVGREDLTNAVALNALLFNAARLVGPLVGVLVLTAAGPALCFWANSVSYLALLFALLLMRPLGPATSSDAVVQTTAGGTGRAVDGFRYLLARPALLMLLLLAGLTGFCGWPFLSLLPALADRVLLAPRHGYFLMLSSTGLGALSAALAVATFGKPERSRRIVAMGVVLVVIGLLGLALVDHLALAMASCVVAGFGMITFFSTSQSVLQLSAANHNRGQVMGIWAMVVSGAQPLGNFVAGPAADRWGVQAVLGAQGILYITAIVTTLVLFRLLKPRT